MTNNDIKHFLEQHSEKNFQKFTSTLIPESKPILGIRIPVLRNLAKEIAKDDWKNYLQNALDDTYEEIILQGFVIGYAKAEFKELLNYVSIFIPKIQNWSVNDTFCATFKIARKHRAEMWDFLTPYWKSDKEFEQRMASVMLMDHFLVDEYIDSVLAVYGQIKADKYYSQMAIAWGIATAYVKFPEKTYTFLLQDKLDSFTFQKSIQKMLESYRITSEQKQILRKLKQQKRTP